MLFRNPWRGLGYLLAGLCMCQCMQSLLESHNSQTQAKGKCSIGQGAL